MNRKDTIEILYDIKKKKEEENELKHKCYDSERNLHFILDKINKIKDDTKEIEKSEMHDVEPKKYDFENSGVWFYLRFIIIQIIVFIIVSLIAISIGLKPLLADVYPEKVLFVRSIFIKCVMIIAFIEIIIIYLFFLIWEWRSLIILSIIDFIAGFLFTGFFGDFYYGYFNVAIKLYILGIAISIISCILAILFECIYCFIYNITFAEKKYKKAYNKYLEEKPEKLENFKKEIKKKIEVNEQVINRREEEFKEEENKYDKIKEEFEEKRNIFNDACNKFELHEVYRTDECINCFIDYLEKGRADSLKECINLFEEEKKQKIMEEQINSAKNIAQGAIAQANETANIANAAINAANRANQKANSLESTVDIARIKAEKAIDGTKKQEKIQDEYHKYSESYREIKRKHS